MCVVKQKKVVHRLVILRLSVPGFANELCVGSACRFWLCRLLCAFVFSYVVLVDVLDIIYQKESPTCVERPEIAKSST